MPRSVSTISTRSKSAAGPLHFAASRILGEEGSNGLRVLPKEPLPAFRVIAEDVDQLVEPFHLPLTEAETLVPVPPGLPRAAARDPG